MKIQLFSDLVFYNTFIYLLFTVLCECNVDTILWPRAHRFGFMHAGNEALYIPSCLESSRKFCRRDYTPPAPFTPTPEARITKQ